MEMKVQVEAFNIRLTDIAEETGFSLPYVGMVLSGKRNNNQIIAAIHLALEAKKAKLRNLIN